MLTLSIIIYLVCSLGVGFYAATRVKNTNDYAVAGRKLPLPVIIATVFATWFGSETVLGIPATFIQNDLRSIVSDPFGSSLCLIFVGVFFARKLYRMNLLTIGDFFLLKYNKYVEMMISTAIILSYIGWVSAQMTALGLVFSLLSDGAISPTIGIMIGVTIILAYTIMGGMWSVALTDFLQMSIIIIGLVFISWKASQLAGGVSTVVHHAYQHDKFAFLPQANGREILAFVSAAITMMLGSIPQQDVFQRVMAAKNEDTAMHGSILGGSLYFVIAFIPMFIAYSANIIMPETTARLMQSDPQQVLPTLVLHHMPIWAQILFFGALLSAIMGAASCTILAPSVTFTENILKHFMPDLSDKQFLRMVRITVLCFAMLAMSFALHTEYSIYKMVENAYKVTLVAAFTPMAFGMYWKRANTTGALCAILLGLCTWLSLEFFNPEGYIPPQLAGWLMSIVGMVVGSYASSPDISPPPAPTQINVH